MAARTASRRTVGVLLLLGAAVVAVVGLVLLRRGEAPAARSSARLPRSARSFVLVTVDTTRADRLTPYGATDAETPHLQALADRGITFEQAYAVAPITLVSHASMLTGLYPARHGVRNNGIHHVAPEIATIAEILAAEGFRTAAFVSAAVLEKRYGLDQGFEHYDDDLSEGGNRDGRLVPDRPAGLTVDAAAAWLDEVGDDERFFAWVHFYDPHAAYSPPPPFRDRFRERPYDGEIAYMDSEIGRLLAHPRLQGLHEVGVAVVGDHGESLGEHGEDTHAILAYDSTLHVPFILSIPGGPAGLRVAAPVGGCDVAPTVLESLGLSSPGMDGVAAHEILGGGRIAGARSLYSETYLPFYTYGWAKLKVVRQGSLKLIAGPGAELYDIRRDPRELSNLHDRMANEAHDLEQALQRLETSWGDAEREEALGIDSESAEQLRALGYLAVGTEPVAAVSGERPNPRDMVDLHVGLERARRFASSRMFDRSVEVLEGVLERDPGNLAALIDLAVALQALHRYDEAVAVVERALTRDPSYPRLSILLASIESERGKHELALSLLERALELDPRSIEAAQRKAQLLHRRGARDEVRRTLDEARSLNPDNPGLAIAFAHLVQLPAGERDAAEATVRAALERDPYIARGWRLLGQIHEDRGQTDEAATAYRQGLRRQPDAGELHGNLGLLLARVGRGGEAAPHLAEAIRLAESFHAEYHVALGALAAEAGRFQEATAQYDLVLEHAPDNAAARSNRAVALYRLGRLDEATAELDTILRDHPRFADAANNRAAIAVDLERWPEAERWARRALELAPDSFEALNNLGVAQDEQGRHAEARASFEKALELEPAYRPARVNLGITLKNLGLFPEALAAFDAALETQPGDPLVHLELGDLLSGPLSDPGRARQHYNAFLRVAPRHPRAAEIRQKLSVMPPSAG